MSKQESDLISPYFSSYSKKADRYPTIKKLIKRVMRIGCLPNMRNIYLWRRKSKKVTKANEFSIPVKDEDKLKETEEFWLGEYVDSKSQIHDSSTSIKNESLNEKEVIHSEPGDELYKLIYDSSAANKNGTPQAKQESIQDQAIQEYEFEGGTHIPHNILTIVDSHC